MAGLLIVNGACAKRLARVIEGTIMRLPAFTNSIYKNVQLLWRMVVFSYRAHRKISLSLFRSIFNAFRLYVKDDFSPRDAYLLGFLSKDFVYGSQRNFISKRKFGAIQHKVNPSSWAPLVEDKGVFYKHCEALGLPVPKLY